LSEWTTSTNTNTKLRILLIQEYEEIISKMDQFEFLHDRHRFKIRTILDQTRKEIHGTPRMDEFAKDEFHRDESAQERPEKRSESGPDDDGPSRMDVRPKDICMDGHPI
jgi:hypothetical protein